MNWHYGYIILCHLLPSVYLNSPLSTQTHRSLCHAHKASAQGSQCLPFLSSVPYSVLPISVHSHSPGTWSWSLAKHRSSTLLQQRFRGKKPNQTKKTKKQNRTTTIIKRAAAENEVHSFAFRVSKFTSVQKKKKEENTRTEQRKYRKRWGNKQQTAKGCNLAPSWDWGGAREEQAAPVAQPNSLVFILLFCVSTQIAGYFKVR